MYLINLLFISAFKSGLSNEMLIHFADSCNLKVRPVAKVTNRRFIIPLYPVTVEGFRGQVNERSG